MSDYDKYPNFDELDRYQKIKAFEALTFWFWAKRCAIATLILMMSLLAGCPQYKVWQQGLSGQAELARAEQNRKIAIEEALALKESSKHRADAEAIRAEGVRKANDIIADGLGGADGYLRYLYIDALQNTSCEIVYVPTEAGLPILEASRHIKVSE